MFKASIFARLFIAACLPGNTTQTPTPASTPDTVYLAAVREFARDMVRNRRPLDDSSQAFFLEDSVDPGSHFDFLTSCLQDTVTFTPAERAQIKRWASRPSFRVWNSGHGAGCATDPG